MEKEKFMKAALKEAQKAYEKEEVPIGVVIVKDDKIIAKAHNLKEIKKDTTEHAEIRDITFVIAFIALDPSNHKGLSLFALILSNDVIYAFSAEVQQNY